jgi:hypothetical protein
VPDISVRLASDDELLIIADGLYVAPWLAPQLAAETGTFLACFTPGDGSRALAERFERIDINHVWAGIACMRARDLVEARDLPDDWSVQSALLRLAVQRGYRRHVLPFALAESGQVALVRDAGEAQALALAEIAGRSGAWGTRLVQAAPVQSLVRRAWAAPWSQAALRTAALALPLGAAGVAMAGFTMVALALLVAGRVAGHASNRLFERFAAHRTPAAEQPARDIAGGIALVVATVLSVAATDRVAGLFTALMLPGLALVLARSRGPLPALAKRLAGSPSLVALTGMAAIAFGGLLAALMIWNLGLTGMLLWQTRPRPLADRGAAPHI